MGAILDAALEYARNSFAVIPVKQSNKNPYTEHGLKDASKDPEVITGWWNKWPNANVAVVCGKVSGNLFVIDVDIKPDEGKHGDLSIQAWETNHGEFPHTVRQITGSGGLHYFFRSDLIGQYKNKINVIPGVDIRGDGAYVVVSPSVYEDGCVYQWEHDVSILDADEIAEANDSVMDLLELSRRDTSSNDYSSEKKNRVDVHDVKEGERNETIFRFFCLLRGANVDYDIAFELGRASNARWDNPLPASELRKAIDSAWKYPPNEATIYSTRPAEEYDENGEYIPKLPPDLTVEFMTNPPPKKKPIVTSFLREGEAMLISGNAKAGKSFLIVQMAIAVATGMDWIGQRCEKKSVLYIDAELNEEQTADRVKIIREKMGISFYPENLHVKNTKKIVKPDETGITLKDIADDIEHMPGKYDLVIIDPLYMFNDSDENDNTQMKKEMINIRRITAAGPACVVVHHMTKGLQAGKMSIDRASGAGVLGRFFDSVATLNLLNTEASDHGRPQRVEADLRSFQQLDPIDLWFDGFHTVDTTGVLRSRDLLDPKKSTTERKNANDVSMLNHCYFWLKDNCRLRDGGVFTIDDLADAYKRCYGKGMARTTLIDHLKKAGYIKKTGTVEEIVDGKTIRRSKSLYMPDGTIINEEQES